MKDENVIENLKKYNQTRTLKILMYMKILQNVQMVISMLVLLVLLEPVSLLL